MGLDDAYTKALLHMNGTDASTTFTDESGKTWTARGTTQIDTAQSVFGGASGLFDGNSDWIDTPDHDDFNLGSGDFTFDFWYRTPTTDSTQALFGIYTNDDNRLFFTKSATTFWFYAIDGSTVRANYTVSHGVSANTWYHLAVVRNGSNFYIFKDGVSLSLTTVTAISTNTLANYASIFKIGNTVAGGGEVYCDGWIDEFRFSKGIARWTSNFTPPTAEYGSKIQVIMF